MASSITEMLKGTLEGCVLEIINKGETYGYDITRQLNARGFTDVVEGTVYAILVRFEKQGLVNVEKRPSEKGPARKFYTLNANGRSELVEFWSKWDHLKTIVDRLREEN